MSPELAAIYTYCVAHKERFKPDVWAEWFQRVNGALDREDPTFFYPHLTFDPAPLNAHSP